MDGTTERTRAPAGAGSTGGNGAASADTVGAGPVPAVPRDKPLLTVPQQIEHLKSKGVTFELCGEAEAARMLTEEASYFALACYRHLFEKRIGGPRDGQYVNLDFGHLAALHGADRALRANVGAVVRKYRGRMPAWVYAQVASFGTLCRFYRFCADRWGDRAMRSESFLLRDTRSVRNACAHGSAIINGPVGTRASAIPQAPAEMLQALAEAGVPRHLRRGRLAGRRMRQIATTLCARAKLAAHAASPLGAASSAVERAVSVLPRNNPVLGRLEFVVTSTKAFGVVS